MAENTSNKELEESFRKMTQAANGSAKAADKLFNVMNELGDKALVNLIKNVKDAAKNAGILSQEQLDLINDSKDLSKALLNQEKIIEKLSKTASDRYDSEIKSIKSSASFEKYSDSAKKKLLESTEEAYALEMKKIDAIEANYIAFSKSTDTMMENAKVVEKFSNLIQKGTEKVKGFAIKTLSASVAIDLMKKAVHQSIDELNKATSVGLQDSFSTIGLQAGKMSISFDEFSDMISKNRDVIRNFGGGTKGIKEFAATLKDTSEDLAYMGKDGIKATGRFTETLKKMGVTTKDSIGFKSAMKDVQKEFTKFSYSYGDSYDQFADLIESQLDATTTQYRLNGLNAQQTTQIRNEILARTENFKMMGLTNEQIKHFNSELESFVDPHKNNQQEKIKGSAMEQTYLNMLSKSQPENKALQAALPKLMELAGMAGNGFNADQIKAQAATPEMIDALKTLGLARSKDVQNTADMAKNGTGALTNMIGRNSIEELSNHVGSLLNGLADTGAKAHTQGLDQTPEEAAKRNKEAADLTTNQDAYTKTMMMARDVTQQYNAVMESSVSLALLGMVSAVGATILSLVKFRAGLNGGFSGNTNSKGILGGLGGEGMGKVAKGLMKGTSIISAGVGLYEGYNAISDYNSGTTTEKQRDTKLGEAGGSALGGIIGGSLGLLGGPLAPLTVPLGAATGGYLGDLAGSWTGSKFGSDKKINDSPTTEIASAVDKKINESSDTATSIVNKNDTESDSFKELKKQTGILSQIAQNTYSAFKPNRDPRDFKASPAEVAKSVGG